MQLNVVGETEITTQLGVMTAQHKVLVCRGLAQQMLMGIDFLTAHKCTINFDTNTVYSKGGPNKMVLDSLIEFTGSLWPKPSHFLQIWLQTYLVRSKG